MNTRFLSLLCLAMISIVASAANRTPFELHERDRVAFIGDTLLEREQYSGYIELALATHFSDRQVTFRNLGWSADTPKGDSRTSLSKLQAGHEPADESWNLFQEQIALVRPTVVFLGYGMANSFDGVKGVNQFKADLNLLIDTIQKQSGDSKVRFVLLSPIRHENLGSPLPDPIAHNNELGLYTHAIDEVASQRGFEFVSLFDNLKIETKSKAQHPLTDDGIHLNAKGYQQAAQTIEKSLGLKPTKFGSKHLEQIRREIISKNQLFFARSRPQNMAYLLGFRKAEQGKNAGEIPKFDDLVQKEDARVWNLLHLKKSHQEAEPAVVTEKTDYTFTPQPLPEFQMAPGFEATLWAENPLLAKPVQMNFDARGRLWVASSAIYPQIEPGQKANDKIVVLEDTNGDGKADKSEVFADGLMVPTGVLPGDDGVYVGQSTELLHFKDTNHDGKADERKVVLASFGTEDSHHNIHTLRWAPDGQMYFNQSIYIRSDLETPHGIVRLKSGGVFNLRPQTKEVDIFLRGFCNPWGHIFDNFGQSFVTDGCGSQGISYGIRDATYLTYAKMRRELKSVSPGSYPKFCGLEIVNSENFPPDWQGNMITSDFRAHRVVRFAVSEDKAGFAAQEVSELMRTTNVTFRPIDAKFGPDGALYIADWSNPIINHGEVDFRDPRRDHAHGRIWRVVAKSRPLVSRVNLVGAKNNALFNELLSVNGFNREQARRVLTERGAKIRSDLQKWTIKNNTNEQALLESLWMHQALCITDTDLLEKVLTAKDGRIRAAGVKVAGDWHQQLNVGSQDNSEFYRVLGRAIHDSHPRVRLEAVRALARVSNARSIDVALQALDQPVDAFIDYGLWLTVNDLAEPWLEAIRDGRWSIKGREKHLEFGIRALEPQLASQVLEKLFTKKTIPSEGPWIGLIGTSGSAELLRQLFDQIVKKQFNEKATEQALGALNQAARTRNLRPAGTLSGLEPIWEKTNEKTRVAIARLAGAWKLNEFTQPLLKIIADQNRTKLEKNAAFESLRDIGGEDAWHGLTGFITPQNEPSIRREAVISMAHLDFDRSLTNIVTVLLSLSSEDEAAGLWRSLLTFKNAGSKLGSALPKTDIPLPVAKAGLKVAREGGKNEAALILSLTRAANLEEKDKTLTAEEMKQLAATVATDGNPTRGEKLFRNSMLACVNCHAIGGAGGKVGPDLTSIGASAPVDYLIESLLFPNSKIKEGYHTVILSTKDEQEYSGIIQRETETEIVIRDSTGKEVVIPKSNLQSRKNGGSLMPSGLIDNLSTEERTDLIRFMSELGKPGPYDASKGNVVRTWNLLVVDSNNKNITADSVIKGPSSEQHWQPIYTTVSGDLLREMLSDRLKTISAPSAVYAATKLQLAKDGDVAFQLQAGSKSQMFVDGTPITSSGSTRHLTQGKHNVVIQLVPAELPEKLHLQVNDGTFINE